MTKREEIISAHQHKIWQGKDGKWRTYIHAEGYPKNLKLICKTTRKALEDTIVESYEDAEKIYTFEEAFNEWNKRRLDNKLITASTYRIYTDIYKHYFRNEKIAKLDTAKTTVKEWQDFLEGKAVESMPCMYTKLKVIIRGTLVRAKKLGHVPFSVGDIFETLEVSSRQFRKNETKEEDEIYFDEEFQKIEQYILAHQDNASYLGILLMFVTGIRIGELVALKPGDFLEDYTLSISRTQTSVIENGKHKEVIVDTPKTKSGIREIPIPEHYHWLIDKIRTTFDQNREYVFYSRRGKKIGRDRMREIMKRICKKCEVPYKSPHKARKRYCSVLLDEEVNPKIVAKLAGHSTPLITTTVYNKDMSTPEDRRECVDKVFSKA